MASQMEYIVISNVPIAPDFEETRQAIFQRCSVFGEVGDVVVSRNASMACVGFYDPIATQEALLGLNRTKFLGQEVLVKVSPPPRTWLPGYIVTMRASRTMLVEQESYLRVSVKLKRCAGVESITSVRYDACLVVASSVEDGLLIKQYLLAQRNRHGNPVSIVFLRKG